MRRSKKEIAAFRSLGYSCDHKYFSCRDIGCDMPKRCKAVGHPRNDYGRCQCGKVKP